MTSLDRVAPNKQLPVGTWVVRLETNNRGWRLHAESAAGKGGLVEATFRSHRCLFAGALHNSDEVARALDVDPRLGDAETLVRAYARWGQRLLERIHGVFALVIWDEEAETLLAARDPMGLYPVFVAQPEGAFLLSNSVDELVRQPDVPSKINLPGLVDQLRYRWTIETETFFESVRRILAGHALEYRADRIRTWRYWDPCPSGTVDWLTAEEVAHFDELLEQAVVRSQALGRPAIFLSGGLDSVSIAAVAANAARRDGATEPWALSLAFPDPDANEEPIQRGVASALGLRQVMLDWETAVGPRGLIPDALELSAASAAPLLNLWMPAYDRLALEGKEHGCETILTGAGGDEWLTVSPFYAADLMRRGDVRGWWHLYLELSRSHTLSRLGYLRNMLWRFGARPVLATGAKHRLDRAAPSLLVRARLRRLDQATPGWLAPDPGLRAEMTRRELETLRHEAAARAGATGDRAFPRFYFEQARMPLDHPIVSMELEESFHQGRRLGMPILTPFWDAKLVEFLYRTPPELLNRGGLSKGLVRDAVARRFPELGFDRQRKVGATGLVRSLMRHDGMEALRKLGGATALAEWGVVDPSLLDAHFVDVFRTAQAPGFHMLWNVVALETWLRAHG